MTDGSATTPQPQAEVEPARWSMSWLLKKASWILLGQFRIPGWVGLAFAIFWGLPAWQSKVQFWAGVARSSGGLFVPLADVLTWPYLPVIIAGLSFAYLFAVSRQAPPDSPRNAASYIMKLPKAEQQAPEWQTATEALIIAAEGRGPLMHARIGVMRALNRNVKRVFNPMTVRPSDAFLGRTDSRFRA